MSDAEGSPNVIEIRSEDSEGSQQIGESQKNVAVVDLNLNEEHDSVLSDKAVCIIMSLIIFSCLFGISICSWAFSEYGGAYYIVFIVIMIILAILAVLIACKCIKM